MSLLIMILSMLLNALHHAGESGEMERVRGSEGHGQPRGYKAKEGHKKPEGHGRGTGEKASLFCNRNEIQLK
jgi:hypothetical protein